MTMSSLLSVGNQRQKSYLANSGSADLGLSSCTVYKNTDYRSASEALEAYIGDHVNDGQKWKIHAKYEKDIEDLLIQKSKKPAVVPHAKPSRPDLRQFLEIRRNVDKSYERLREQSVHLQTDNISAADRLLTEVTLDNISPFTSDSNLQDKHEVSYQPVSSTTLGSVNFSEKTSKSDTQDQLASVSGLSLPVQSWSGATKSSYVTELPQHLRKSWLDTTTASYYDEKDFHNGYHSDSSIDMGPRDTSFMPVNSQERFDDGKFSYYTSHSAPQSPRMRRSQSQQRYGEASFGRNDADAADDTLTQLMSGRRHIQSKVPSWVNDLADDKSPELRESLPPVSPTNYPSTHLTQSPYSPRKQLRFDLDMTQSSIRSEPDVKIPEKPLFDKPPSGWKQSQLRNTGILKSSIPRGRSQHTNRLSLTTEDISSSLLYGDRNVENNSRRHHTRSFSANARLSSTPIKAAQSSVYNDRPHISGLSSVHSGSTTSNHRHIDRQQAHSIEDEEQIERPTKYLCDAVSDAESRSQALGVYDSIPEKIPPKSAERIPICKPSRPVYGGGDGRATMRVEHQHYLKDLVQDIDDHSSSVVTGYTELQDIIHGGTGAYRGLVTPTGPGTQADSLVTTPNTDMVLDGDRSWEKPWSRKHTKSSDPAPNSSTIHQVKQRKSGIVDKFLQECRVLHSETDKVLETSPASSPRYEKHGNTSSDNPGSMEALKNMLFTMQNMTNVESLLAGDEHEQDSGHKPLASNPDDVMSPNTKTLVDSASKQGGDSLERALVHLGRLKTMVKGSKDVTS